MPSNSTWIKAKAKIIVESVLERYDNPRSRRTRLAPFLAVCRKMGFLEAYKIYYEPFKSQEGALQELREQQGEKEKIENGTVYMNTGEVETFGKKLARKVRSMIFVGDLIQKLSTKEIKIIMVHLLLEWSMLVDQEHQSRVKLYDIPIVQKRGEKSSSGCYLLETSRRKGSYKLVFDDGNEVALSKMLNKYIHRTLEILPREYLLTSISQPESAMTTFNFTMFCSKIECEGKRFDPKQV
jgi:hypothetical protein